MRTFFYLGRVYGMSLGIFLLLFAPVMSAQASHYKGTYPNEGLLWMSPDKDYAGEVWVTSNNCNSDETDAYSLVTDSTDNTTQMADWPDGIQMFSYNCTGNWSNLIDIRLRYRSNYPTGSWGINNSVVAPSAFCTYWNETYPCGMRPTVSINQTTWNNISTSNSRKRLIMHETGHSHGLSHHCSADSIMNNGLSNCNNGRWTQVMSYLATDRTGINNVYP